MLVLRKSGAGLAGVRFFAALSFAAIALCGPRAACESPFLVKDIHQRFIPGSLPPQLTALGSAVLFVAADDAHGVELWRTEGNPAGTALVKDLLAGPDGSRPESLTVAGGRLYFIADDGVHGREVWRSDGTEAGTVLLGDLTADFASPLPGSLTAVGGLLYFATRVDEDRVQLWKTDGTPEGTVAVKEVPGSASFSLPRSFTAAGLLLYFVTSEPGTGTEVWRSDGTPEGTEVLKDIVLGPDGSRPDALVDVAGVLYFSVRYPRDTGDDRHELWRSDGLEASTLRVKELPGGPAVSLTDVAGTLYFVLLHIDDDEGLVGAAIWKSDGTEGGTTEVRQYDLTDGDRAPHALTAVGSLLFFIIYDGILDRYHLWRTGGEPEETFFLFESIESLHSPVASDGALVFAVGANAEGPAIGISNGTPGLASIIQRFPAAGPEGICESLVAAASGTLFGVSGPASGLEVWKTDGSPGGTSPIVGGLRLKTECSFPESLTQSGDAVFFQASQSARAYRAALWKTDGTADGTIPVQEPPPEIEFPRLWDLTDVGGRLFFWSYSALGAAQIWRTDDTGEGTTLQKEFPVDNDSAPTAFQGLLGLLFFRIAGSGSPTEVWRSDGMPGGTTKVLEALLDFNGLVEHDGSLFYTAATEAPGSWSLWRTDGTAGSEAPLKAFSPEEGWAGIGQLVASRGFVFFVADRGFFQPKELWRSDGTPPGTVPMLDFSTLADPTEFYPLELVDGGATLFFFLHNGLNRSHLWKTNGSAGGTEKLKEFDLEPFSPEYPDPVVVEGKLYFQAAGVDEGFELWRSDATPQGTGSVADIHPGTGASYPQGLAGAGGLLFFSADDGRSGRELWQTDGTSQGTRLVADIHRGPEGSGPASFASLGSLLFFAADDGFHGHEPWALRLGDSLLRGDADGNGRRDLTDAIFLLNCLFRGGPCPTSACATDINSDDHTDIADPISLLAYLFQGGREPQPCP